MEDPATPELLDQWMAGETEAGEKIYFRYIDRIRRYALKWTQDTQRAEEIAGEVFAHSLEAARRGHLPRRFTFWAFGIARHMAINEHRVRKRFHKLLPNDMESGDGRGPATLKGHEEIKSLLREAMDELPPHYREVIRMKTDEGLDRGEIAQKLGLTRETVDRRFSRAHDHLREAMRRHVTSRVGERGCVTWNEVCALRPSLRSVMIMRHAENLSIGEIARQTGVPEATVNARMKAAYSRLGSDPAADYSDVRAGFLESDSVGISPSS